jgi:hypothetical protein
LVALGLAAIALLTLVAALLTKRLRRTKAILIILPLAVILAWVGATNVAWKPSVPTVTQWRAFLFDTGEWTGVREGVAPCHNEAWLKNEKIWPLGPQVGRFGVVTQDGNDWVADVVPSGGGVPVRVVHAGPLMYLAAEESAACYVVYDHTETVALGGYRS